MTRPLTALSLSVLMLAGCGRHEAPKSAQKMGYHYSATYKDIGIVDGEDAAGLCPGGVRIHLTSSDPLTYPEWNGCFFMANLEPPIPTPNPKRK